MNITPHDIDMMAAGVLIFILVVFAMPLVIYTIYFCLTNREDEWKR